jgi:hypothetical protein
MRTNRLRSSLWLILMSVCCVCSPTNLPAGQDVRILVEVDEQGAVEPRASTLRRALAQGVFQEVETLLQSGLSEPRRSVLQQILEPRAQEYVLGWEENEYLLTEWGAVLHLDVRINREALQKFLQSMGTYYTREDFIGYSLAAVGLESVDMAMVRDMEVLSGLRQDGSQKLMLRLGRFDDGSWRGSLDFEELFWSAEAAALPELWIRLWSNYFGLERVSQTFEDEMVLSTRGWNVIDEIQVFDRALRDWHTLTDKTELQGMALAPDGFGAQWRIVTMDRGELEANLARYLREKDIDFSIE